jgi:hypothetical protein
MGPGSGEAGARWETDRVVRGQPRQEGKVRPTGTVTFLFTDVEQALQEIEQSAADGS